MIRIIEPIEIEYYVDDRGGCPFLSWSNSLENKATRAMVLQRLVKVAAGNLGDCKRLVQTSGIWELRIHEGPGYRIYFGRVGKKVILLLCGGTKKTQAADIARANKYWRHYQEIKQ